MILTPPRDEANSKVPSRRTRLKGSTETAKKLRKSKYFKENEIKDNINTANILDDSDPTLDIINQTLSAKIRWRGRIFRINILKVIELRSIFVLFKLVNNILPHFVLSLSSN